MQYSDFSEACIFVVNVVPCTGEPHTSVCDTSCVGCTIDIQDFLFTYSSSKEVSCRSEPCTLVCDTRCLGCTIDIKDFALA